RALSHSTVRLMRIRRVNRSLTVNRFFFLVFVLVLVLLKCCPYCRGDSGGITRDYSGADRNYSRGYLENLVDFFEVPNRVLHLVGCAFYVFERAVKIVKLELD